MCTGTRCIRDCAYGSAPHVSEWHAILVSCEISNLFCLSFITLFKGMFEKPGFDTSTMLKLIYVVCFLSQQFRYNTLVHDNVIKWKHFPRLLFLCGEFTGHRNFGTPLSCFSFNLHAVTHRILFL